MQRMKIARNGSALGHRFGLDPLEPRALLSTTFVGVGLGYSEKALDGYDAWAVLLDGSINDTNDISGTLTTAGPGNPVTGGPLGARKLLDLGAGRLSFGNLPWLQADAGASTSAASFLDSKGFPLGWSVSDYAADDQLSGETFFFIERPTNAVLADLQGDWAMSLLGEAGANPIVTNASLTVTGSTIQFVNDSPQFDPSTTFTISSVDANGTVNLASDTVNRIFISRDKSVMLFVGLGGVTDDAIIGVAVRGATTVNQANLPGSYRVNAIYSGDLGTAWEAADSGTAEGLLTINANNTWSIRELAEHDKGNDTSVSTGTWSITGNIIALTETASGAKLQFVVNAAQDALFGYSTATNIDFMGVATKTVPPTVTPTSFDKSFLTYTGESGGKDKVWELGDDSYWREVDVTAIVGSPAALDDVVSWIDDSTGRTKAAAISATSGVIVFTRAADGVWSLQELTPAIAGAEDIASQLEVMQDVAGTTYILGVTAAGDIVAYINATGSSAWTFKNITDEDLVPNSQTVPVFTGNLVSYDTNWGGLNLAGLDANGDVWSVWYAPGLAHWNTSNLSQITGASVKLAGGLTVYLTPWLGINIGGVDTTGNISVVWWVPEFGGEWRQNDLTAQFNGPKLTAASVTSYTTSWGGLNVVGFDSTSGEVKVYWWAPGLTDWNITSLSQTVGADAADPVNRLQGIAGTDGSLNVLGFTSGGSLINYFWKPEYQGTWYAKNVSDDALKT
jgi:hypothetical protein